MPTREILDTILALDVVSRWAEMRRLLQEVRPAGTKPCWEYPGLACQAAGGTVARAVPGGAAILCLIQSIHLVDDLLDQDPAGHYRVVGRGPRPIWPWRFRRRPPRWWIRALWRRINGPRSTPAWRGRR